MSDSLEELLASSRKPAEFLLSAFADHDLQTQLQVLDESGVRFVELRRFNNKNLVELSNDELNQAHSLITTNGTNVSAVGSTIGYSDITESFEAELAKFDRTLEIADWLGSSYVQIGSYRLPSAEDHAKYRAEILRRLEKFTEIVLPYGLILLMENAKGFYADTAEHCADLLDTVGSANLRSTFNPANFVEIGQKPFTEAFQPLARHITYLRFKQGAANCESEAIVAALRQTSYVGYVTIEPATLPDDLDGQYRAFGDAVDAFQAILNSVENKK